MYASTTARAEEIETGAGWPPSLLRDFVVAEQEHLAAALGRIAVDGWQAPVVTAQGRTVPASMIPWLRSREVWIHATDLPAGGDFAAFPGAFLDALIADALDRRRTVQSVGIDVVATDRATPAGGSGREFVQGPAVDLARWLTRGERSPRLRAGTGAPLPPLPPWL
jgi:maleylpyruvate isomerase